MVEYKVLTNHTVMDKMNNTTNTEETTWGLEWEFVCFAFPNGDALEFNVNALEPFGNPINTCCEFYLKVIQISWVIFQFVGVALG